MGKSTVDCWYNINGKDSRNLFVSSRLHKLYPAFNSYFKIRRLRRRNVLMRLLRYLLNDRIFKETNIKPLGSRYTIDKRSYLIFL